MANIKFSQFTTKTDPANVDFLVGYLGGDNVKIDPANLGGGGASDLNGLSDCLVDTDSLYIAEVPSGLSGNPQGNTVMGIDAGAALTSGTNNTFIGNDAGLVATTTTHNVLVGFQSGKGITTTSTQNNVCIGANTFDIAAGQNSVAIGYQAGRISSVSSGVYIGYQAGWANAGAGNVGIGYESLFGGGGTNSVGYGYQTAKNNTASGHTSIGYQAGFSQTSGPENTNIGYLAGYDNTTNGSRTCVGYQAGKSSTGAWNTMVGAYAGRKITGAGCVAIGRNALLNNTSGANNVAIGHEAGNWTATGGENTFVGTGAGRQNSTGGSNTAVGYEALFFNLGSNNTCIGRSSGGYVTTTSDNTFLGYQAGKGKTSGTVSGASNVAIGSDCFTTMVSASNNVVIGYRTLGGVGEQTGNNNTFVGNSIYFNAYFSGSNTTALGNGANPSAQNVSNEITLGNSSIGTLRCQQTSITSLSDQRDKKDIETIPYGLDFVNSLKPKKFVWDNRAETDGEGKEFYSSNKGKKDIGFIAQELQTVDDDYLNLVYDANPEKLEATYGKLIPVLVKAIQDLSAKVTALENA